MATTRFYSKEDGAREGAVTLSDELKQTVYIYKNKIDTDQYEYQLRTADQVINIDSEFVIHCEKYNPRRQEKIRINSDKPGLIRILDNSDEPQLIFTNTGPITGEENHYGNIFFEDAEIGCWKVSIQKGELRYHLYIQGAQAFVLESMQKLKLKSIEIWQKKMQ